MEANQMLPHIADVYTDMAQYRPGRQVEITVEICNPCSEEMTVCVLMEVLRLNETIGAEKHDVVLQKESAASVGFAYMPPNSDWQGYGVDISLIFGDILCHNLSTAFDVADSWKRAPRYGFLCDFGKEDEKDDSDIRQMVKYHLNVVQFYDWMCKHDDLIPPIPYYVDPMGRQLSLIAVRDKIDLCHRHGMTALAYGAVYAASKEFYEQHTDWALYDNCGNVQSLGNWLIIMNISNESPWSRHIVGQFSKAIQVLGFDGIHMDTYGFPKTAYSMLDGKKNFEKLHDDIPNLINLARSELEKYKEDVGLSFNAVNNWPVDTVAPSELDTVYIEVWEPNDRYNSLYRIINHARELGRKPVILAAYLTSFSKGAAIQPEAAENCFLLVSSVIFASGGYHLLLGEENGLLRNEYFVDYARISDGFVRTVRNYYDFIVRYSNLLYEPRLIDISMTHANGRNGEFIFENGLFSSYGEANRIWTIVKEMAGYKTISLINLTGMNSDIWNEPKLSKPQPVYEICIKALIDEKVTGVFSASPDTNGGRPQKLAFEYIEHSRGKQLKFIIPELNVWTLVCIEVEQF